MKQFVKSINQQTTKQGFTLIEMLISASILALMVVSVCGIYLFTIGSQRKAGQMANTLQDAQFVMETLAKNIRTSEIDYNYAYNADGDSGINLSEIELALKDSANPSWHLYYKLENEVLKRSTDAINWYQVTMSAIKITSLKFYIIPYNDPFSAGSTVSKHPQVTILIALKPPQSKEWITLQQTVPERFTEKK